MVLDIQEMLLSRAVQERPVVVLAQLMIIAGAEKFVCQGRSSVAPHLLVAETTLAMLEKHLLHALRIVKGSSNNSKEIDLY